MIYNSKIDHQKKDHKGREIFQALYSASYYKNTTVGAFPELKDLAVSKGHFLRGDSKSTLRESKAVIKIHKERQQKWFDGKNTAHVDLNEFYGVDVFQFEDLILKLIEQGYTSAQEAAQYSKWNQYKQRFYYVSIIWSFSFSYKNCYKN